MWSHSYKRTQQHTCMFPGDSDTERWTFITTSPANKVQQPVSWSKVCASNVMATNSQAFSAKNNDVKKLQSQYILNEIEIGKPTASFQSGFIPKHGLYGLYILNMQDIADTKGSTAIYVLSWACVRILSYVWILWWRRSDRRFIGQRAYYMNIRSIYIYMWIHSHNTSEHSNT